ncbi:MAG: rod shape-determining protein [Alphaproteobacteria bacterium]|nr:rod shape-determining protein [Alphaproteobacteria bacterium]
MLTSMFGALSADVAIDMGSSHTRIHVAGRGIVCCQASAVAVHEDPDGQRRVLCVGDEALEMLGRTPPDIEVIQPVREGDIVDFDVAEAMLRHLMLQVQGRRLWVSPRAAVTIPHGMGEMARRAVRESVESAGIREVVLVEQPVACAVGAELPVEEARGHMIIEIGGGSTTVAVLSLDGVVHHHRLKVGGSHLDQAIAHHLRERHGLLIGARTAEELKLELGAAVAQGEGLSMEARGRSTDSGWPRAVTVTAAEVEAALAEPVRLIIDAVLSTLEHTPPDLASDVAETGIIMVGGGALLRDLDRAIGEATGLPVVITEDPVCTAVLGAASRVDRPTRARVAAAI